MASLNSSWRIHKPQWFVLGTLKDLPVLSTKEAASEGTGHSIYRMKVLEG